MQRTPSDCVRRKTMYRLTLVSVILLCYGFLTELSGDTVSAGTTGGQYTQFDGGVIWNRLNGSAPPGDCDNSGSVTIDEVQSAINMYLGLKQVQGCVDLDGSGQANIAEVQATINSYLGILVPTVSLQPAAGSVGEVVSVSILGTYTDFVQGTTNAAFGPDIAVGSGSAGAAGVVTVTGPTTATALVTIGPNAATGIRTVSVTTGASQAAAYFTVKPSGAASISAVSGTPQSTRVNTTFSAPLVVVVKDATDNPVPGMLVSFAAPAAGAGGTFAGGVTTAVTDAAGMATSALFTANGVAGEYSVTAIVAGVIAPAGFLLANLENVAQPASMFLTLSQSVLNGGGSLSFADVYYDAAGKEITPSPVSGCSISPVAHTGQLPSLSGKSVTTAADTRGSYTLTCTLAGSGISQSAGFVVIAPASPTSGQAVLYGNLSLQLTETSSALGDVAEALSSGEVGAVQGILDRMRAARSAVDLRSLQRSTPFAPEGGFVPTPAALTARGFGPGANDANFAAVANNLIVKLMEMTAFVNSIDPLAMTDATGTRIAQLNSELQTLINQFSIFTPSLNGIVSSSGYLNKLLSDSIPVLQHALVNKAEEAIQKGGLAASGVTPLEMYAAMGALGDCAMSPQTPDEFYGAVTPAFFGLIGLMAGESIQGQLISMLYGDAFRYLENAMITLAAEGLLGAFVNNATLDGIITGGSLSFHIFYAGGSVIEGSAVNPIATRNDVLLVGPDQVEAVRGLLESFVPGEMEDLDDIYDYFEGIVDAIQAAGESYDAAHQTPDEVYYGCILGGGDYCSQAYYNEGFSSVYTCGGWFCPPAPVIVILHNLDSGQWSWGMFNFVDG